MPIFVYLLFAFRLLSFLSAPFFFLSRTGRNRRRSRVALSRSEDLTGTNKRTRKVNSPDPAASETTVEPKTFEYCSGAGLRIQGSNGAGGLQEDAERKKMGEVRIGAPDGVSAAGTG